jgi:hypothetical protein
MGEQWLPETQEGFDLMTNTCLEKEPEKVRPQVEVFKTVVHDLELYC